MGVASFSAQEHLCLAKFQAFMRERLPEAIFRIKGHVHFDAAPDRRYSLQMSGRRRFDVRETPAADGARGAQLVFIGRGAAGEAGARLVRALQSCVVAQERGGESSGGAVEFEEFPLLSAAEAAERCHALRTELGADKRFVVEPASADAPHLALFGLHIVEWHNIDPGVLHASLLATLNAAGWGGEKSSAEVRSFLTLTTGEGGGGVLRFDGRDAQADVAALVRAVHAATASLLTKLFFSNFCCGYR